MKSYREYCGDLDFSSFKHHFELGVRAKTAIQVRGFYFDPELGVDMATPWSSVRAGIRRLTPDAFET
ncbi:MAG: hypothetical protein ACREXR_09305 [Gammaproteobacteria bacterium]